MKNKSCMLVLSWLPFLGNLVEVKFHVVDSDGVPVANAMIETSTSAEMISVWSNQSDKHKTIYTKTDENGQASCHFLCWRGSFDCYLEADDCYPEKKVNLSFATKSGDAFIANLAGHEKEVNFKVYRKKSPVAMCVRPGGFRPIKCKAAIGVYEYDMEKCDYLPPYGHGEKCDMKVEWESVSTNNTYECKGKVTFIDGGAYIMQKIPGSTPRSLQSVYRADSNQTYKTEFSFYRRHRFNDKGWTQFGDGYIDIPVVKSSEYFVFRVRERRGENGELIEAHYGKMYGVFHIDESRRLMFGQCSFNPNVNDNNLEVDTTKNLHHGPGGRESVELRRAWLAP